MQKDTGRSGGFEGTIRKYKTDDDKTDVCVWKYTRRMPEIMKKVVKFGGSSLASAEQFKKVGDIITRSDVKDAAM